MLVRKTNKRTDGGYTMDVKCQRICNNKTPSGYCQSTVCIYPESEPIWNSKDKKAAQKALQTLAIIKALCNGVPGGAYVDEDILKEIVAEMGGKNGSLD